MIICTLLLRYGVGTTTPNFTRNNICILQGLRFKSILYGYMDSYYRGYPCMDNLPRDQQRQHMGSHTIVWTI